MPVLVERLRGGASIALVTDAGTPLLSDPGSLLVAAAARAGIAVVAVPGPCAAVAALSIAGLPTERFAFEGFLPAKAVARREALQRLAQESRTLVFYEAPHRLAATLADLAAVLGAARPASIARELTKRFEQVYRGTLGELAARSARRRQHVARRTGAGRGRRAGRVGRHGGIARGACTRWSCCCRNCRYHRRRASPRRSPATAARNCTSMRCK